MPLCVVVLVALVFTSACGSSRKSAGAAAPIVKTCVLPPTETNTLQGKWAALPIKLSFHNGDFSQAEINSAVTAGGTWNNFFGQSRGLTPLSISASNISSANQAQPTCGGATISDGVVLYKRTSWTKASAAVAITTTCFTSNQGSLATISNAIMEFNYQNFFLSGTGRFPDIQSIALHEMGHVLGLDHTCGPLGAPNKALNFTNCPDPTADPNNSVIQTVMYPSVFFDSSGNGQVKQTLTADDQGRANCLYP